MYVHILNIFMAFCVCDCFFVGCQRYKKKEGKKGRKKLTKQQERRGLLMEFFVAENVNLVRGENEGGCGSNVCGGLMYSNC